MTAERLSVLVVDDHQLMLEAVSTALADASGIDVRSEARSGEEAIAALAQEPADVVLLDLRMPGMGGLDCLEEIKRRHPSTKVVVLSGVDDPRTIRRALALGADAFVSKLVDPRDVAAIVRQTAEATVLSAPPRLPEDDEKPALDLSGREQDVLAGMARGLANKEIAHSMGLSEQAIKYHASKLYAKLGVGGRIDAVRKAYELGLLDAAGGR